MAETCDVCGDNPAKVSVGGVQYCSASCLNSDIRTYQTLITNLRDAKKELRSGVKK